MKQKGKWSDEARARITPEQRRERLERLEAGKKRAAAAKAAAALAGPAIKPPVSMAVAAPSQAAMLQSAAWVFANMGNLGTTEADEPVPGAFAMLERARADDASARGLDATIRSIMEKAEVQSTERFHDDGRDVDKVLDQLIADFKAQERGE